MERTNLNTNPVDKITCASETVSDDSSVSTAESSSVSSSAMQTTQARVATQTGASSGQGKIRIDPLQLLTCLSILLNNKGGIKSIEEVQRVAGLMGKYSKKLVSKCIYLNILQATDGPLLDEFYSETGWNLVGSWLTEAMLAKNYPLAQQILSLLLISPVTVDRLKKNNTPKIVKDLSKECTHIGTKSTAEKIVQKWKNLVKSFSGSSVGLNSDLSLLDNTLDISISDETPSCTSNSDKIDNADISLQSSAPLKDDDKLLKTHMETDGVTLPSTAILPDSHEAALEKVIDKDYVPDISEDEAEKSVDEDYVPAFKAGRRKGAKATRGGTTRGRGRRKRGASTRGRGKGALSYAELLNQDLDNSEDTPSDATELQNNSATNANNKPIKITIRNGTKLLAQVKSRGGSKRGGKVGAGKKHRISIDSTDSDDNKPLSMIRNECQLKTEKENENLKPVKSEEPVKLEPSENETIENNANDLKEAIEDKSVGNLNSENRVNIMQNVCKYEIEKDSVIEHKTVQRTDSLGSKSEFSSDSEVSDTTRIHKRKHKDEHSLKDEKDGKKGSSEESKSKDKHKDKRKEERKKDKETSKDRDREKDSRSKEKHRREHEKHHDHNKHDTDNDSDRHHKERDRKGSSGSDKKRSSREKTKEKNKDSDKKIDEERKDKKKDHERKKEQAEKDKATLDKVKPLSTEGLAKIPRKPPPGPVSFLDALGSADSDLVEKRPPVKAKSRGFRNTGLFDEAIKPPGVAGKRSTDAKVLPSTLPTIKRQSSTSGDSPQADKRPKTLPSSIAIDRPGGVKLISPKRPALADDGGFMAALTAAGGNRKKIARKRKSSESDPKTETSSKSSKIEKAEESSKTESPPLKDSPEETSETASDSKMEVDKPPKELLSPTSTKPTLNFYKETLKDDDEKEEAAEVTEKEEESQSAKDEASEKEDGPSSPPPENQIKKDDDNNMEIEESEENGENERIPKPPVIAPSQEEYEKIKIEVMYSKPMEDLKSVLIYHRSVHKPKKGVRWKTEEDLKEIFYFPMDETERVNVNTIKFNDMMMMEKAREKELMFGKHKNSFHSRFHDPFGHHMDGMLHNNCEELFPYKLYPVHLPCPSKIIPGCKSLEKHIQAQREHNTMAAFFHPAVLPDTPSEPDPEIVPREEPKIIPLDDGKGNSDNVLIPWPEPILGPPEYPFMGGPMPVMPPPQGGHWVQGNQPVARFDAGPMYGGPNVPQGMNQVGYMPQGFPPNDMRGGGGWGGPPDFGGHPNMMQNGPGMMGPGMPGQGMQGGPPMQGPMMGNGGMGMGMNMGNHSMNRGDSNKRFRHKRDRGGGSWRGGGSRSTQCRHFMRGHCRAGNDCPFPHGYN